MPNVGSRRSARERALALLYEAETKGQSPGDVLRDVPVGPEPFVITMVVGVEDHAARIDALIAGHAFDWTLDRMPAIDRTLLRMATFELTELADVPTAVVISEAVDLAKQYSTDESGRFVNGVLAAIAAEVRAD
ncbi:MAG: transcription antitermination factor NusB [Actinomycetota bacterium]|nr:transcription antitermination factor NusB [Actinomycetota bacterium]